MRACSYSFTIATSSCMHSLKKWSPLNEFSGLSKNNCQVQNCMISHMYCPELCLNCIDLNNCAIVEINNSFCPHSCVVAWPIMAPSAKPWAIHIINQLFSGRNHSHVFGCISYGSYGLLSQYLNQWRLVVHWVFRTIRKFEKKTITNFLLKKKNVKMSLVKWWPCCRDIIALNYAWQIWFTLREFLVLVNNIKRPSLETESAMCDILTAREITKLSWLSTSGFIITQKITAICCFIIGNCAEKCACLHHWSTGEFRLALCLQIA